MEQIKQIELHCPKCKEIMIADIDLESLVQQRAKALLGQASDPRTIKSCDPKYDGN